jgi:hypothetical protein
MNRPERGYAATTVMVTFRTHHWYVDAEADQSFGVQRFIDNDNSEVINSLCGYKYSIHCYLFYV